MKNCYNCGALLEDSASFCQYCGASFEQQPVQQNAQYQNYNQQQVPQNDQYQNYNQQQMYQQGYAQQNYSVVQQENAKPKKSKAPIIIIICTVVLIIVAVVIGIVVKSASSNDDYDDTGYYDSLNEDENEQNDVILPVEYGSISYDGESYLNESYGLCITRPDENWIFDDSENVASIYGALYDEEVGKCYVISGLKRFYYDYMMYNTQTNENLFVAYQHYDNEEIISCTPDDIIDSMEETLVSLYEEQNLDVVESDPYYGEVELNGYTYKRYYVKCISDQGVELYQEYYISIISGNVVQICLTAGTEESLAQMEGCIVY